MLATPELLREPALTLSLGEVLSRSIRDIPLYGNVQQRANEPPATQLQRWPFITKEDIRRSFPSNFLPTQSSLEDLLDRNVLELEHTSGTSEERTPLLLPRGWWAEQELRALRVNASVAELFRHNPGARRATINSPVCSGDI